MSSRLMSIVKRTVELARHRPKGWQSVLYNTALAKAKIASPLMMPAHISIEPANVCNARCPVCETGNGSMERPRGLLNMDDFTRFIDQVAPTTSVLMYYFMGEPFLNKNAYEMIRYARSKDIYVETCTDGDFVDAHGILYSDINQISFQIGGMTSETHGTYRVNSDLPRVLENLEALLEERENHPDSNVQIEVGFIVMKHNEHEVPEFLKWAKEIGVDKASVVDPGVKTMAEGEQFLTKDKRYWRYDENAYKEGFLKPKVQPHNECTWIWNSVMVNWDGSIVPCCTDPMGKHVLGNAFEAPLSRLWNSPTFVDFRKRIVTRQKEVDICRLCSGYGTPQLMRSRPTSFSIQRLSHDSSSLDIPEELLSDLVLPK